MLFNSLEFILAFLPATLLAYFLCCRVSHRLGLYALLTCSALFYGFHDVRYAVLLLGSISFNYALSHAVARLRRAAPGGAACRLAAATGIAFNLGLLGYFKYTDFFIANLNGLAGAALPLQHIVLPLGISFFTFQQIGYVVDVYKGENSPPDFSEYAIFVVFFPHLVAGPIVHNREIILQFQDHGLKTLNWDNLYAGLTLFAVGLAKKVIIADTFALYVPQGFDQTLSPHFFLAWASSLSYTLQLYFDFSGYSDMAIGLARMFNITFPQNFNNPYRALSIQDFWRRWHMTLSRFLQRYLYIPLGGNRGSTARTLANLFATFLLGGLWHGASWCFVVWGALHGAGMVAHRLWSAMGRALPRWLAWPATFLFVHVGWVFFRAKTLDSALGVLRGMAGLNGLHMARQFEGLKAWLPNLVTTDVGPFVVDAMVAAALLAALLELCWTDYRSAVERLARPAWRPAVYALVFALAVTWANKINEFIYFQF